MKSYTQIYGEILELEKLENLEFQQISKNIYLVFFNNKPFLFKLEKERSRVVLDDGINKWQFQIYHFSNTEDITKVHSIYEILSPIPGLIVDVLISEGQEVKKDDILFIIEAMKMRNQVRSPADGIVKYVKVQKGKNVNIREVLAIIEKS
ncbi:MAG: acetyl-CoA carboxylase biotin carboxyl carrier protein subunit [candidate division WOR-3 bacterium]|nr:acetyl-CoA carboxylase biotin carboxyl carrier protein subunit [candidate division WOR-3 bacterium]MCX7947798.1 acetyl-CoA carboxylase biotin carboxyl carrier protein subunit [candidate division WOR-3 bacterium]MDW8150755.1 acetyl-CoA carboxylase biotin carboxyl carrier protein subunit [candidate division WOR-3 bacterium]